MNDDDNTEIKTIIHKIKKRIIISPNESKDDDNDENINKINKWIFNETDDLVRYSN